MRSQRRKVWRWSCCCRLLRRRRRKSWWRRTGLFRKRRRKRWRRGWKRSGSRFRRRRVTGWWCCKRWFSLFSCCLRWRRIHIINIAGQDYVKVSSLQSSLSLSRSRNLLVLNISLDPLRAWLGSGKKTRERDAAEGRENRTSRLRWTNQTKTCPIDFYSILFLTLFFAREEQVWKNCHVTSCSEFLSFFSRIRSQV